MPLYDSSNPAKRIPFIDGVVSSSSAGSREVSVDGVKYEDRKCARAYLRHCDDCFIVDSPMSAQPGISTNIEFEEGARVRFYVHETGKAGIVSQLAGAEIFTESGPILRRVFLDRYFFG